MVTISMWPVFKHLVFGGPFLVIFARLSVNLVSSLINSKTTAVEGLFCLDHQADRVSLSTVPGLFNKQLLVLIVDGKSCTGAGKLNQEDQEEDDHVEEKEDLVVPNSSNEANH